MLAIVCWCTLATSALICNQPHTLNEAQAIIAATRRDITAPIKPGMLEWRPDRPPLMHNGADDLAAPFIVRQSDADWTKAVAAGNKSRPQRCPIK